MLQKVFPITDIYMPSPGQDERPQRAVSLWRVLFASFLRPRKVRLFYRFLALFLLNILVGCGLPQIAVAETLSIEELTARTQNAYEKTKDLKAFFVQEVTIKAMQKTEREEGVVWLKNPRRMYWDYRKPGKKKLVINPTQAWLYVPEDGIVYIQKSEDIFRSRLAVKFLSGLGKLAEDFLLNFSENGHLDQNGNYLVTLLAKDNEAEIKKIHLSLDQKTFLVRGLSFADSYGNTTRLSFHDIKINTGVPDSFFVFTPPADVEIVHP